MFPVDQLTRFEASYSSYKLLKPWWEVLTDYLAATMLVIALLTGVMKATQDRFVCLPIRAECDQGIVVNGTAVPITANNACNINNLTSSRLKSTLTKLSDRRQYDFVENLCGEKEVHWFASYFSFILFLEAFFLLVIDNFWLTFPVTSSMLEHFVNLVTECFNTPGTSLAVSNALWGTNITEDTLEPAVDTSRRGSIECVERQPLLYGKENSTDAGAGSAFQGQETSDSLVIAEAMKAKALYEKMRQFRKDLEPRCVIFRVYLAQAVLQLIVSVCSVGLNADLYNTLQSSLICDIDYAIGDNYKSFECSNALIPKFQRTLESYFVPLICYTLTSLFVCCWTFFKRKPYYFTQSQKSLKFTYQTSADEVDIDDGINAIPDRKNLLDLGDISHVTGDFAFVNHLLNAYSTLYSKRFTVFLSRKNEKKLKDAILLKEWPVERLQALVEDNGRTLKLSNMNDIPKSLFVMDYLDSLIIERCTLTEDDFEPEDWRNLRLRSLSLIQCGLTFIPYAVLEMETLETLNLSRNKITIIPQGINKLQNLHTFEISDNRIIDGVEHIIYHPKIQVSNLQRNDTLQRFPEPVNELSLRQLYVDEHIKAKMTEETVEKLKDILIMDKSPLRDIRVIKYLPERAPAIEAARRDSRKVYKMTSKPKGLALIFNNQYYGDSKTTEARTTLENRLGSEVDARKLHKLFEGLGFHVNCYHDLKGSDFKDQMRDILTSDEVGVDCDSIIIAILSHGTREGIIFHDAVTVPISTIVGTVCEIESYRGKPKMFFIQSCRGTYRMREHPDEIERSQSYEVKSTAVRQPVVSYELADNELDPQSAGPLLRLPTVNEESGIMTTDGTEYPVDSMLPRSESINEPGLNDDVLISCATLPGHVSWRSLKNGSWFIRALVEVFSKYAWQEDVLSLLTFVNYEVSRKFKTIQGYRQIPAPQSTLTKKLFFLPGYFEDEKHHSQE